LLRRSGDHHVAEDLTQRVFTDAVATLARGSAQPDVPLAWLYRIAERRFADELRRRQRRERAEQDLSVVSARETRSYDGRVAAALRHALEQLNSEIRDVVVMKLLEGRSFAEIAIATHTNEGACRMRFSRALKTLQTVLAEEGIEPV
jgi:RNA polymerase sigma-70 factor (ECF subfamily)